MIQQTNVLADAQNLLKGLLKQIFLVGIWFEGFYSDYLDGDKMNRPALSSFIPESITLFIPATGNTIILIGEAMQAVSQIPRDIMLVVFDLNKSMTALDKIGVCVDHIRVEDVQCKAALLLSGHFPSTSTGTDEQKIISSKARSAMMEFDKVVARYCPDIASLETNVTTPSLSSNNTYEANDVQVLETIALTLLKLDTELNIRLYNRNQNHYYLSFWQPAQLLAYKIHKRGLPVSVEIFTDFKNKLPEKIEAEKTALKQAPFNWQDNWSDDELFQHVSALRLQNPEVYKEFKQRVHVLKRHYQNYRTFFAYDIWISPDGRIHPFANRAGNSTRITFTHPAIGSISRKYRPMVIADCLIEGDLTSVEIRILASLSQDPVLIQDLKDGDIYCALVRIIFPAFSAFADEQIQKDHEKERDVCKRALLGGFYGMGRDTLAEEVGISKQEAKSILTYMETRYKIAARYLESIVLKGKADGYLRTPFGHIRSYPGDTVDAYWAARSMRNYAIQAPAGDAFFKAAIAVNYTLAGYKSRLIFLLHDSFLIEGPSDEAKTVSSILDDVVTNVFNRCFPGVSFSLKIKISKSWGGPVIEEAQRPSSQPTDQGGHNGK